VNSRGEVIGVVAFSHNDGGNNSLNFAISVKNIDFARKSTNLTLPDWTKKNHLNHSTLTDLLNAEEAHYKEALDVLDQHTGSKPQGNRTWALMGYMYDQMDRYRDAIDAYKNALQISPNDSEIYIQLGDVYYEATDYDNSLNSYATAIKRSPKSARAFIGMAACYLKQERYLDAKKSSRRALAIDPKSASAHFHLGMAYAKLGDGKRAIEEY
jgi:cytochrome c-type biogenesis protein CcmH/NrfG